jgi:hypothetical protein
LPSVLIRRCLALIAMVLLLGCRPALPQAVPPAGPTATASPTSSAEVASPSPSATPISTSAPLGLGQSAFENWTDLSVFRDGIVRSEQHVLSDDQGLSIYHLDFVISEDLRTVSGREEVRYTDTETEALDRVEFRLYPNILGGRMTISDLTVDGRETTPAFSLADSLMTVPLAQPLEPEASVTIGMDFEVTVPDSVEQNYGVLSSAGSVLAYAHGYPVIALHDESGWHAEIPSPWGDVTVADAAYYLVGISAPADLKIAASGTQISAATENGRQRLVVEAGPARDFYFAGSSAYVVSRRQSGDVAIQAFSPPGYDTRVNLALDVAQAALQDYSMRYGPYPYTELDLVLTPTSALGIEYPGTIALNQALFTPEQDLKVSSEETWLESTVAHEVAHQWFYNEVGNDQLTEPWLDESLAQFATWRYFDDVRGATAAQAFEATLRGRWSRVDSQTIAIGMPVSSYNPASYSAIVYGRGPLFLDALSSEMGEQAFDAFMHDYAVTERWRVATTGEFKSLAEEHCACDLTALFNEWVYP